MIIEDGLREKLIDLFQQFEKNAKGKTREGRCFADIVYSTDFDFYLNIADIETKQKTFCVPCYILFTKLRVFVLDGFNDCQCMCHFLGKGTGGNAFKKAWRYINGEWG